MSGGRRRVRLGFVPMEELSNAELIKRAAGDDDAFRVLQHRFKGVVWAASYGFRFNLQTREDIAQLVWLKLFQHLDNLREPDRIAGWLATVTRRECLRLARRHAIHDVAEPIDREIDAHVEDSATEMIRAETIRTVAAALAKLDARCQRLLRLLTAAPPLSYQEIGEALDVPIGSIGPTRQRCLEKLAMDDQIGEMFGTLRQASTARGRTQ
jgi:RNA polymerase sigma factor (sigma-70 family)